MLQRLLVELGRVEALRDELRLVADIESAETVKVDVGANLYDQAVEEGLP